MPPASGTGPKSLGEGGAKPANPRVGAPSSATRASKGGGASARAASSRVDLDTEPSGLPADIDDEGRVAFLRKHAADLEDEARRHLSGDASTELARLEEERERLRRVTGYNFDERRRKRGRRDFEQDEDKEEEDERGAEERRKQLVGGSARLGYFGEAPPDRMGDETLVDPNEMRRALGASVRFAQHAMLLAELRLSRGASRGEALAFLAGLYQGLDDRDYAEKALRSFGPGTGILDLYPLELVEQLLDHVPGFLTKTRRQPLFGGRLRARARPGVAIALEYDPSLRIRGFALQGGPRPGYRFEPVDPPGHYLLSIESEGRFDVMVSAITRDGWVLLDAFEAHIDACAPETPEMELTEAAEREQARAAGERPKHTGAGRAEPERGAPAAGLEPGVRARRADLPDDLTKLAFPRRI